MFFDSSPGRENTHTLSPPPSLLLFLSAAAAAKSLQLCPTLCDSIQQPTRVLHPWDSPGKNPAVGCHFLLQCMKRESESEPTRLLCPWDFPGKSTGLECHCLLHHLLLAPSNSHVIGGQHSILTDFLICTYLAKERAELSPQKAIPQLLIKTLHGGAKDSH